MIQSIAALEHSEQCATAGLQVRNPSIDILRGLAIVLMIYTHFYAKFIDEHTAASLFHFTNTFSSFLCVPLFYFTVGLTLTLRERESAYVCKRAFMIAALGMMLNVYEVGVGRLWHWSTLQIIAAGYLLAYSLRGAAYFYLIAFIAVIVSANSILSYRFVPYSGEWDLKWFIQGVIFSGGYPLLGWAPFFLLGNMIGRLRDDYKIVVIAISTLLVTIGFLFPVLKRPVSLGYYFAFMGGSVLSYYIVEKFQRSLLLHPLHILGMFPLTLFIGHIVFAGEIVRLFHLKLTMHGFFTFFILFILACALVGHIWIKNSRTPKTALLSS